MLLGYEKMTELGNGEQIKSRLISTQVEIIIVDGSISMVMWAGAMAAITLLDIV